MSPLLNEYGAAQAERRPEAPAVTLEAETLTYGELEASSNRLARLLRDAGCEPGDRVCLFMPKSPAAVVGMLASLKAGCIYVPMEPVGPARRVARILATLEPALILAGRESAVLLGELFSAGAVPPGVRVGTIDRDMPGGEHVRPVFGHDDWTGQPPDFPRSRRSGGDPAHILFTSGSTGLPKGVVITHDNVSSFIEWAVPHFGLGADDRTSGHSPLFFDLSTFDVYGTLAAGAHLFLVPPAVNLLPHNVVKFIREAALTQWFSVPTILAHVAAHDALKDERLPTLRRVLWCGDVLPTPALIYWMHRLPRTRFTNLYGPTEATIASTYFGVPAPPALETATLPIGTPCDGEQILILDERLDEVAAGEVGEICIAGPGLSPGYWRDAARTAAAFVAGPEGPKSGLRFYRTGDLGRVGEDGAVQFLGRTDSQVKSRGYRIELGEIEAALHALDGVREGAVVGIAVNGLEGTAICCAYASSLEAATPARVADGLRGALPGYMVPTRWMRLERLPAMPNGKIDRPRLRDMFARDVHG